MHVKTAINAELVELKNDQTAHFSPIRSEISVEPVPQKNPSPARRGIFRSYGALKLLVQLFTNISPLRGSGNLRLRPFAPLR
jgi:hypothetical protein